MKVKIGKYLNWVGPYQIAEALCFWAKPVKDEHGFDNKPKWVHNFGTWLADTKDGSDSWLTKLCLWIHNKRKRTVKIKIDKYDTWNMDGTLALIIEPMLVQLQKTKQGSPSVDDSDVPVGLRSTSAGPKENEWDTDEFWHKRWEYVMNEMIFAFKLKNTDDWEKECYSGVDDSTLVEQDSEHPRYGKLWKMVHGPNHTRKFDSERYNRIVKRQENGFRLFGKYFNGLWD
jgi:hypothetical protein